MGVAEKGGDMAGPGNEDRPAAPEMEYADPVDPWATAEAAAIAAGGQPGGYTPHPYPGGTWTIPGAVEATAEEEPAAKRRRTWLWAGGAAVVATAAVTAAAVILWPGVSPIDFVPLAEPRRVTPSVPVTSTFADTEVLGDRAYLAGADDTGTLRVVAADTTDGSTLWESDGAGQATTWKSMFALPGVVLLLSGPESATSTIRVVALNADDGKRLWDKRIGSYDEIHLGAKTALWTDREGDRIVGIGLSDGAEKWSQTDPDSSAVHLATTVEDLAGPAGTAGRPFSPDLTDDERFVQIGAEQTATVRDLNTGKVVGDPLPGVASTSDEIVVHGGRLYVRGSAAPQRILSYDLGRLTENPVIVHTAPPNSSLSKLTPCGERLCFVQTESYDRTRDRVFALGKDGWPEPVDVPEVEALVPVGGAVLAVGDETTTVIDEAGRKGRAEEGVTVRLDAGNMLRFSDSLTTSVSDRAVWGIPLGASAVPLGQLTDVRSASCSWNTSVIVCAAEEDYVIYRFTD
ncbi:outer membrane protein assembly factor BamB family protein [Actinoplanes flavus]|uniref:PQQ-binding-like beta-propeller repeat protein n=1 Tax=Actinoplanes flavus TaxID=2820290 RepID=A0ABS3URP6_9ACTN|nr:PQQ-binding-like beta-propeller repeat protein [Actinoplanes flavus]MBO3740537.1 PQQ-binding-like beta-propeller repeat protein [Actinoplanes flavus]